MSRRPYYVVFSAVLLIALAVLNLPERHALRAKLLWGSVFMPLFGLAGSVQGLAGQAAASALPRTLLLQRLEALSRTNQTLLLEAQQARDALQENARLHQAIAWQRRTPWNERMRLARVLSQEPSAWWRSVIIDLGSRHGLQTNMPVLTPAGIVGKVTEVGFTSSKVLLVGDPNCRFSAQVEESRDKGIVSPDEGSIDRQVVQFSYVPTGVQLQPGSTVITSGDGGVFPRGVPVGRIIDVQTNEFGLYLEARVRLAVNLNRLEEVFVLFP